MQSKFGVPTFKIGFETVSVWGGLSSRGRTTLVGTMATFPSDTYCVVIDNRVLTFMYDVHVGPASFILQEDNCGLHHAKFIAMYLPNEDVMRMKWPSQSPT